MDQELCEKSELRCMWAGIFSILNSSQGYPSPFKLISSRWEVKSNITGKSRKVDNQPAFVEECQKAKTKEAANSASEKSVRSLIQDDLYIDSQKNKKFPIKYCKLPKAASKLTDRSLKPHKQARKTSHLSAYRSNQSTSNDKSSIDNHHQPSNSPDSDEKIMQQARMTIKAFIDQMFVDGKFVREKKTSTEPLPFSDALQVLRVNNRKDSLVDHLQEPDSHKKSNEKNEKTAIFSVREMKHKLKHLRKEAPQKRSDFENVCRVKKIELKEPPEAMRTKIDFSISRFSKREEFDLAVEIKKRRLSARLKSLTEHEFFLRRDNQCSCSPRTKLKVQDSFHQPEERKICLSPVRKTGEEVIITSREDECKKSDEDSSLTRSTDEEDSLHESSNSEIGYMGFNGESETHIVETKNICHSDGTVITDSTSDLLSENDTFTSTTDDLPSTPRSAHSLNTSENIKNHDEQESPVSVLEQLFFAEDANNNSPSNITLQTGRKRSHPRCLHFERFSIESYPQDQPMTENAYIDKKDYISKYVQLVLQSSFLNWEQLSEIGPRPQKLLHSSLFDEIEFLTSDHHHINHRLLFDHVNEVLLEIHRSHFSFFPWPEFFKPKKCILPLEKFVLDEIMRKTADYSLLTSTEGRTVDQLLANDVSDSRSWIDARTETEYIMIHISEDILEECVLDIILGSRS
ncbi:phosphatidylinositolN-acetyglucosaminlytransferase subunit P-related [Striga asiatica]|uniref:PhosphatidylinositolN-acetyglucosaminlytransferase subunit P-related n=1 Tax=Striga asiatica TaxID=4170 RepID=A0A5A7QQX7_STRAF|nr:phosphatidylinositolN-acetyglucosaminlytransferase subunit P-related [Striga asiatica]